MIDLVTGLLGGVQGGLLLFGGAVAAILAAYIKGRSAGKAKARNEALKDTVENLETRDAVEDRNAARSDADIRDRLRHWER